ncbi:hypothetical protein H3V53_03380 [Paraburkholderia bengalensis]|uniref:Uncharacterized protein n=1 Tax=Paraburkholderia bengalensis TaxID=2747562 RepID=A0ABU8IL13_9BURK
MDKPRARQRGFHDFREISLMTEDKAIAKQLSQEVSATDDTTAVCSIALTKRHGRLIPKQLSVKLYKVYATTEIVSDVARQTYFLAGSQHFLCFRANCRPMNVRDINTSVR